jgi:hypothetical protein
MASEGVLTAKSVLKVTSPLAEACQCCFIVMHSDAGCSLHPATAALALFLIQGHLKPMRDEAFCQCALCGAADATLLEHQWAAQLRERTGTGAGTCHRSRTGSISHR